MATIVTKVIRIYPKGKNIKEIDCERICRNLAETVIELWEKVIYNINYEENCLDIKYKSRRGYGDLGIENQLDDFDIWVIACGDGIDYIKQEEKDKDTYANPNIYKFDEIKIIGNHEELLIDFYPKFFYYDTNNKPPYLLSNAIENQINNTISFNQVGIYTSTNDYDIDKKHSLVPELVSKEKLLELRGESSLMEDVLFVQSHFYGVKEMIETVIKETGSEYSRTFENLTEIQFYFNKRIVQKISWEKTCWKYSSSDWFDNCIEPTWIKFQAIKGKTK